jgi:hypothetical protein
LGEGTQGSFQPSLKSVESRSGRQVFGSGFPKTDWVIVSKNPSSTLEGVGSQHSPVAEEGTAPLGWVKVPGPPPREKSTAGVGLGDEDG